jgi:putative endonuclease
MYYIYILYSESSDHYYIGQSSDVERRLVEHNTADKNSYTAKFRPWILKVKFPVSESLGQARIVESYVKKQKSRRFIERLITDPNEFEKIVQLVRAIPRLRD